MAFVKLKNPILGVRSFEWSHAERILTENVKLKQELWALNDPKLTFSNGKIITGRRFKNDKGAEEQG